MEKRRDILVLSEFRLYLRLLTAYDRKHFLQSNSRRTLRSLCYAIATTSVVFGIPFMMILAVWHVIDNGGNLEKITVALPVQTSITQMELTFVSLMMKSRTISKTFNEIQKIIDQRK